MKSKAFIWVSLFFLCFLNAIQIEENRSLCDHKHHGKLLCSLEVGPPLDNPPKIYSRFHERDARGYRLEENQRGANNCITADIDVEYSAGFSDEAKDAFQFAVEIWEKCIVSDIRIRAEANFQPAPANNLGSAGPVTIQRDFNNATYDDTYFPVALANSLSGSDLDNTTLDIEANFNSIRNDWYFGIDGNCPADKFDFVTVVLHELCHGLGFVGSATASSSEFPGLLGFSGSPFIYDQFVEDVNGTFIVNHPSPSYVLGFVLTTNVFYNGPNTMAANNNFRAKLYAPNPFKSGSSYSHFDENSYGGELMTPFLSPGEVIHDPGDLTIGLLEDNGWEINRPCYSGALYVDRTHTGTETGTNALPFNTFKEAVTAADQGNYIYFKSNSNHVNSVPIVITKRLQLRLASGNAGPVIIK